MDKMDFFEKRNRSYANYDIVQKRYANEDIIVRRAYIFAAELLMSPIQICGDIIFYNEFRTSSYDSMGGEQIEKESDHIIALYPEEKDICNDAVAAKQIGLLQRWAGGHASMFLDVLFDEGYQSRIEKTQKKFKEEKISKKKQFYRAELIVLKAAQKQILRYAQAIEKYINNEEIDENKKNNLIRANMACKNVAVNPPKNFFEAVQLIALTHEFCRVEGNGSQSWGIRIDQLLIKYYDKDIAEKKLNRHEALDIIISLWKMYDTYGERCANLTLGGCNSNGDDMCNEMTLICMEASMKEKACVPLLTLRVHPELDEKVWNTALQLVQCGQGFPAFYNDPVAIKAKMNAGISRNAAFDYSTLGCVELTIAGREYDDTEGARINWLKLLEVMLFDGKCLITDREWRLEEHHRLEEFTTFDQFYNWYKRELMSIIVRIAKFVDKAAELYSDYWPVPYLSSLSYGCFENGSDITEKGTKYYTYSINCAGMANAVNSLEVIEQLVYKEKIVTFEQLKDALKHNYKGYEELRKRVLLCPKYGNDVESVDKKMADLMKLFSETVHNQKPSYRKGMYQCGFYTVMHHALLGEKTGASCDGRFAYTSLANSLSPTQGTDVNGPTALINSVNKVSMQYMGNGGALDIKFLPSYFDNQNHVQALRYLIETYFEDGGLELQINVVDSEILKKAQMEPDKYKNLVVRVSGYSAYFVNLDKELQNEIIMRTEEK